MGEDKLLKELERIKAEWAEIGKAYNALALNVIARWNEAIDKITQNT